MDTRLLREPKFRLYLVYRLLLTLSIQMQAVAVAWHVYDLTQSALSLGYVGLAIFLPVLILALPGGKAADRYPRRTIMLIAIGLLLLASIGLRYRPNEAPLELIYIFLVLIGTARAFGNPATSAYLAQIVGADRLPQAVALNSTVFQFATIAGPALAGFIFSISAGHSRTIFGVCTSFFALALILLWRLPHVPAPAPEDRRDLRLLAGLQFIWREKMILGALSLDLFAVLLGGAVALLPIFARDILHAGPQGLGLLRSAPATGAMLMAIFLSIKPLHRQVGRKMFVAVFIFGLCTIAFGLSRSFPLSLLCLVILGATDMISVVIRQTLIQTHTPDSMRGRVSAVNMVFIGASNELGEFESGITAAWLGAVPAVVIGGIGTCLVVVLGALLFPALRRVETFKPPSSPP